MKTLVIILSETRAYEATFDNFKKNVIDELDADLCICIGQTSDYNYTNPFYQLAKYKFLYDEPDDFADAFDFAYKTVIKDAPKRECLNNINALYGKLKYPNDIKEGIIKLYSIDDTDDDSGDIVIHTNNFSSEMWRNTYYKIMEPSIDNLIVQDNVNTLKQHLPWREFLKIKDQWLGGIKDKHNQHNGSAGILIFFRWFLLKNLLENDLISKYDRFIITRSDYIYQLPHPRLEYMDSKYVWFPDSEHYGGYTDRHVCLSKDNIIPYLNIFNNMVLNSNKYYALMKIHNYWNLEKVIKFNLEQNKINNMIREFPYVMYTIRLPHGKTRWIMGKYNNDLGYFIKYDSEYQKSTMYKNKFIESGLYISDFYKNLLRIY